MKKGSLFETVVHIVQKALNKEESATIYQNHYLRENTGINREFDIIIEYKIDNFNLTVAIECKDYKSKISIGKIEEFYAKCSSVAQVNKMIFVTRNGFQKGAKIKAKSYGIDLLLLEKISELEVMNWLQIGVPLPFSAQRLITSPSIEFLSEPFDFMESDILILENMGVQLPLIEFMSNVVQERIRKTKMRVSSVDSAPSDHEIISLKIDFSAAFLIRGDKKSRIKTLRFNVETIYTPQESEIYFDKYKNIVGDNELTQSVTVVSENNEIYSLVKRKEKDAIDIISKIKVGSKEEIIKIGEMKIRKIADSNGG